MGFVSRYSDEDHPRVCGEYVEPNCNESATGGSPPRVRGILAVPSFLNNDVRITPACAGNTLYFSLIQLIDGDHPRVCGEYAGKTIGWVPGQGSPPRVRGIL